jgi:lipopolysaccharide/colanic/teichoic acid biosynthesis glycosyltransferase
MMTKRLFDLITAATGLLLFSPLFAVCALLVWRDSPGPIFYRGARIGRNGKPFYLYKFRSMIPDAEQRGGTTTSLEDARLTRVGRRLRKYKLDELPQLLNIVRGEMSWVGPRPQVAWAVARYRPEEKAVLGLRPGLTDWASIHFHNEEEIVQRSGIADPDAAYLQLIHPEKMRLQLKYLHDRSFWVDLRILHQTARTLWRSRVVQARAPGARATGA